MKQSLNNLRKPKKEKHDLVTTTKLRARDLGHAHKKHGGIKHVFACASLPLTN